jgi:uncharacterized membrane protein
VSNYKLANFIAMPKLHLKQKNWLLSGQVASGSIWFGTSLCMVLISLNNRNTTNGDKLYAINSVLKLLDDFVIIPSATLSSITGALLCWLTMWGFTKHYWMLVKWVVTVVLIVVGTAWLGPLTHTITGISQTQRLQALPHPLYVWDQITLIIGAVTQTLCLLAMLIISVLKPWGRRKLNTAGELPALNR